MDEITVECVKRTGVAFTVVGMSAGNELKLWSVETDHHLKKVIKIRYCNLKNDEIMEIEKIIFKERTRIITGKYNECT